MSSPAPESLLPKQIDPRKFAQQGISVSGSIELHELSRLPSVLANNQGRIDVDLQFGIDEQRIRYLTGTIAAQVQVICQRCLEPTDHSVEVEVNLAIVWDDEKAKQLDKSRDPWIVGEGQADIYEIIEEELILSIPLVNYHDTLCIPAERYHSGEEVLEDEHPKENPFQALAAIKANLTDNKPDNH